MDILKGSISNNCIINPIYTYSIIEMGLITAVKNPIYTYTKKKVQTALIHTCFTIPFPRKL